MKKVFKILVLGAFLALGSCNDDVISKEENMDSHEYSSKKTTGEVFIYNGANAHGGIIGWGIDPTPWLPPGTVLKMGDCNSPGECQYAERIGGIGRDKLWKVSVLNSDILRLSYITPREYDIESLKSNLIVSLNNNALSILNCCGQNNINYDYLYNNVDIIASHMYSHYNIPKYLQFDENTNEQLNSLMGLESGTKIYVVPNDYLVNVDDENPLGYIDINIYIQNVGQQEPPSNPNTSEFSIWNGSNWINFN